MPKETVIKKRINHKRAQTIQPDTNSSLVQQNILLVALITIIVSLIGGYMFFRKDYSDGTLFLAIGLALLSSLVDLNRLPRVVRFIVYAISVVPAALLIVIIFKDFT